jgi:hypothetical protein
MRITPNKFDDKKDWQKKNYKKGIKAKEEIYWRKNCTATNTIDMSHFINLTK